MPSKHYKLLALGCSFSSIEPVRAGGHKNLAGSNSGKGGVLICVTIFMADFNHLYKIPHKQSRPGDSHQLLK